MQSEAILAWVGQRKMSGARYIWAFCLGLIMLGPSLANAQTREETIKFIFENSAFKSTDSIGFSAYEGHPPHDPYQPFSVDSDLYLHSDPTTCVIRRSNIKVFTVLLKRLP